MENLRTVLCVEDHRGTRETISKVLARERVRRNQKSEIRIDECQNFQEGLQRLGDHPAYHGLILDMTLNHSPWNVRKDSYANNGARLARIARERGYTGPIVIISGGYLKSAMEQTQDISELHGGITYIQKPISSFSEFYDALDLND